MYHFIIIYLLMSLFLFILVLIGILCYNYNEMNFDPSVIQSCLALIELNNGRKGSNSWHILLPIKNFLGH